MNVAAIAAWAASHPWIASAAAVLALFLAVGLVSRMVRRRSRPLLRSAKAQAAFKPVQTVYTPKSFRRDR
nr:hypothetical protein [Sphingomonas koreensis]